MFKNLIRKKSKEDAEIYTPLTGEIISLMEVPDPVFAQKMMGDGFAIIPKEGILSSPVTGEVLQVFPTKHAIGIKSKDALEILIHVGLETVELNGEGFEVFVNEGQSVKVGDPLLKFDIPFLRSKNKEVVTPVVITNSQEKVKEVEEFSLCEVSKQDLIMKCQLN